MARKPLSTGALAAVLAGVAVVAVAIPTPTPAADITSCDRMTTPRIDMGRIDAGRMGEPLTVEEVTRGLRSQLGTLGDPGPRLGNVQATNENTIVADVIGADGTVLDRILIDRRTGRQTRLR